MRAMSPSRGRIARVRPTHRSRVRVSGFGEAPPRSATVAPTHTTSVAVTVRRCRDRAASQDEVDELFELLSGETALFDEESMQDGAGDDGQDEPHIGIAVQIAALDCTA